VWHFSIVYSDGVSKVVRQYSAANLDDSVIAARARTDAAELNKASTSVGKVSLTKGSSIDLTEPAVTAVVASPADIAQAQFFTDYVQFQRYQRAISVGVIDAADKRVLDLAVKLKTEWLDSYLAAI
jgi:hypothetical protein